MNRQLILHLLLLGAVIASALFAGYFLGANAMHREMLEQMEPFNSDSEVVNSSFNFQTI